jgi:LDH2 family malate/lactate/ureidoglycolate dehydrogenase
MSSQPTYLSADNLRVFARTVFTRYDLPEADAQRVAEGLVKANLRGLDSHGVARIPIYCERLRRRCINPRPVIKIQAVTPVVARVDGDDGIGFVVGERAMDRAIRMAQDYGVALVGVHRSTHYGMAALYVTQAIGAGCIGLAYTNSSPAMPVWGGRTVFLGASPFAAGAPAGRREPYVLDLAMTVIARGKIRLAAQRGDPIPLGLALDADGRPTTDAGKAFEGVLLPFGGVKGSGIGLLMEILAGVLTGANFGGEVKSLYFDFSGPQNVGHLFMAIKPDLFMPRAQYEARMDTLVERAKACPMADGFEEILMPGEPEARSERQRGRTGIPLTPDVRDALRKEAERAGVPFPQDSPRPIGEAA